MTYYALIRDTDWLELTEAERNGIFETFAELSEPESKARVRETRWNGAVIVTLETPGDSKKNDVAFDEFCSEVRAHCGNDALVRTDKRA